MIMSAKTIDVPSFWKAGDVYKDGTVVYMIVSTEDGLYPMYLCNDPDGTDNFKLAWGGLAPVLARDCREHNRIITLDGKYMKQQLLKLCGIDWEKDYVPKD